MKKQIIKDSSKWEEPNGVEEGIFVVADNGENDVVTKDDENHGLGCFNMMETSDKVLNELEEASLLVLDYAQNLEKCEALQLEYDKQFDLICEKTTPDGKKMYTNDVKRGLAMAEANPQLVKDLWVVKKNIKLFDYNFRMKEVKVNNLLILKAIEAKGLTK